MDPDDRGLTTQRWKPNMNWGWSNTEFSPVIWIRTNFICRPWIQSKTNKNVHVIFDGRFICLCCAKILYGRPRSPIIDYLQINYTRTHSTLRTNWGLIINHTEQKILNTSKKIQMHRYKRMQLKNLNVTTLSMVKYLIMVHDFDCSLLIYIGLDGQWNELIFTFT